MAFLGAGPVFHFTPLLQAVMALGLKIGYWTNIGRMEKMQTTTIWFLETIMICGLADGVQAKGGCFIDGNRLLYPETCFAATRCPLICAACKQCMQPTLPSVLFDSSCKPWDLATRPAQRVKVGLSKKIAYTFGCNVTIYPDPGM